MPGYIENCCITELFNKPGLVQIDGCCPDCGCHWNLVVTQTNLVRWINGELIQKVWPNLPSSNLELLISGLCNECFTRTARCEKDDDV